MAALGAGEKARSCLGLIKSKQEPEMQNDFLKTSRSRKFVQLLRVTWQGVAQSFIRSRWAKGKQHRLTVKRLRADL